VNCMEQIYEEPPPRWEPSLVYGLFNKGERRNSTDERRRIQVISVTSGKGGVGKSNVVVNVAMSLARLGKRVLIIDADLGLANIHLLLGLDPLYTLNDVFAREKSLQEIIIQGPGGIKLVPAGSGEQRYTSLGASERLCLLDELDLLEDEFDVLLIDTEAGISENVTYFAAAAQEILVVTSPELTSITGSCALIKLMATRYAERRFNVLVNMAKNERDGITVFESLSGMTGQLGVSLDYLGSVLYDELLLEAVKRQRAVCDLYPEATSSCCFESVASRIAEKPAEPRLKGNIQFMFRKASPPLHNLEKI